MAEPTNFDLPLLNATLAVIYIYIYIYIYPRSTAYLDHPEEWRLEEEPWRALLALLPGSVPGWQQTSRAEELPRNCRQLSIDGVVVTHVGLELDITEMKADVGLDLLEGNVTASSGSVVELCYCACVVTTRYTERPQHDLPATSQLRLTTLSLSIVDVFVVNT